MDGGCGAIGARKGRVSCLVNVSRQVKTRGVKVGRYIIAFRIGRLWSGREDVRAVF